MACHASLCFSLVLGTAAATNADNGKHKVAGGTTVASYRLPDCAHPVSYEMEFSPNPQQGSFSGKALIKIDVTKSCRRLLLNAKDLKIQKSSITGGAIKRLTSAVVYDNKQERAILEFAGEIPPGQYNLSLAFTGVLNDTLNGFYRSKYVDHSGKSHYLAVTQMEPTSARRMFPCFDEPDQKASFKITAVIDPSETAISNAPVEKEYVDSARRKKIVRFEPTPRMSTYLVALLIGEFKPNEATLVEGVPIRVWAVDHDPSLGNYARDTAAKILPYLNAYFRIPYPWKKLDLVAIPDFEAGAMENPGAITFREKLLIVDESGASLDTKQSLASVVAHEMAHMWFGDLVTMKWWDDLWLNEAFATWMSVKAVDNVRPEWKFLSQFGSERQWAMVTDSLHSSRAIHAGVKDPNEALQMFDEITYSKGASILRMLEVFLSESVFQDGIHNYLKKHEYGNASTNGLWQALSAASGQPVSKIMDCWTNQAGYPLVSLTESASPDKLEVKQEKFFLNGTQGKELWQVPLRFRSSGAPGVDKNKAESTKLLSERNGSLELKDGPELLTANAGGCGFYRVSYPPKILQSIATKVESDLTAGERVSLLSDQYALAVSGRIGVGEYLKILSAFRTDDDAVVWETLLSQLAKLDMFVEPAQKAQYQAFVRFLLSDIHKALGWEAGKDDSAMTRMIRGQVIGMLGTIGQDKQVISMARLHFLKYVHKPASVNPDLLDAITSIVAYNGNAKDFEAIRVLWKKAGNPEVEKRNLFALSGFREPILIKRCLDMSLASEVRSQDQPHLLRSLLHNHEARYLAWEFMTKNWARINKQYPQQMISGLGGAPDAFSTEDKYKEIKSFFATHKVYAGESDVARMLERLQINVRFAKQSSAALNAWLKTWKP